MRFDGLRPSQLAGAGNNFAPRRRRDRVMPWLFLIIYILFCLPIYFWYVVPWMDKTYYLDELGKIAIAMENPEMLQRNIAGEIFLALFISFFASVVVQTIVGLVLDAVYLITKYKYPKDWL